MTKCCSTNTCVELVPSGCVRYTGTPTKGGLIDSQKYCDPYLNDVLSLLDDTIVDLDTRLGITKSSFDSINQSCGTTPVINTSGLTVKNDKYSSAEVMLKLVDLLCQLRSRLNYLSAGNINDNLACKSLQLTKIRM